MSPSTINLDNLQEVMKGLENGNHTLTRDDIILVAQVAALINHQSCPFGFEREEVDTVKSVLKRGKWIIYVIGLTVLTSVIGGCITVAWKTSLWLGKLGAIDAATTTLKGH